VGASDEERDAVGGETLQDTESKATPGFACSWHPAPWLPSSRGSLQARSSTGTTTRSSRSVAAVMYLIILRSPKTLGFVDLTPNALSSYPILRSRIKRPICLIRTVTEIRVDASLMR